MTLANRRYTVTAAGSGSDLADLAEDYPLLQTQALVLSIEEALSWLTLSRSMFGVPAHDCLTAYSAWLDQVEETLESLMAEIDEDDDLARCRQSADDPWYDSLDDLLENFPEEEIQFGADNLEEYEELRSAFERMATFWAEQLRRRVVAVLNQMSGDGEVLAILSHYKRHRSVVIS
jgi:hypothetical protein